MPGDRTAILLFGMTDIQPQLWIDRAAAAVAFYEAAFGAQVVHRVGAGDDIVAQLVVGDSAFWVSSGGADGPRFSPRAIGGTTGRQAARPVAARLSTTRTLATGSYAS